MDTHKMLESFEIQGAPLPTPDQGLCPGPKQGPYFADLARRGTKLIENNWGIRTNNYEIHATNSDKAICQYILSG